MTPLLAEFATSFGAGLLVMGSPCIFPLYPGFLAYLSGQAQGERKVSPIWLGILVFLGVITMMMALGALIAALSVAVGNFVFWITPAAYLIIILLGILLLFGRNPFLSMSQIQAPVLSNPYANAFVYGLLYGPIAFPCSGPLLVSIFTISLSTADVIEQLAIFFFFGLGFGLPLFLLAILGQSQQQRIVRLFMTYHHQLNLAAGVLLIGIGAYGLWVEWEFITFYLGIA